MSNTFPPSFIKAQLESVVDNSYDWMEGKTPTFQFSVPIDQKRETLIQQLAIALEPQLSAIPVCNRAIVINCRPSTSNLSQFATEIAAQSINGSGSFDKPITNKTFADASSKSAKKTEVVPLSQLPRIRSAMSVLLFVLPIVATLGLVTIAFLAPASDRLKIFAKLARRLFFSMFLSIILCVTILWFARDSDFGIKDFLTTQSSAIAELVAPFLKNMITGFAGSLLFWSGTFGAVGLVLWTVLAVLDKRLRRQAAAFPQVFPLSTI